MDTTTGLDCAPTQVVSQHDFEELYRSESSVVYTHLLHRGLSRADAEDLAAEVFATFWRRRSEIRLHSHAGARPYLLAIANNLARDRWRSLVRARRALQRVNPLPAEPDIAEKIVDAADDTARLQLLLRVFARLTTAEQEVIQSCVISGIPPSLVAEATAQPPGTVRSRLSRALVKARRAYDDLVKNESPAYPGSEL